MTSENIFSFIFNSCEQGLKSYLYISAQSQTKSACKQMNKTNLTYFTVETQTSSRFSGGSFSYFLALKRTFNKSHSADGGSFCTGTAPRRGLDRDKSYFLFPSVSLRTSSPLVDFGAHTCRACSTEEPFNTQNANCDRPSLSLSLVAQQML